MNKLGILILILLPIAALAQEDVPLLPSAPFVVNAPAYACWSVAYKSKPTRTLPPKPSDGAATMAVESQAKAQTALHELNMVTVTKAGTTRRMVSTWSDGTTSEQWIIPGFQLWEQPGQEGIHIFTTSALSHSGVHREDYSKSDFPEFDWLSASNYARVESYNKIKCWCFQDKLTLGVSPNSLPMSQILEENAASSGAKKHETMPTSTIFKRAWIDTETKLPVALDDGMKIQVFTFLPAPNEPPVMPARFSKVVKDYKDAMSALESKYRMNP
jgi:hypothetical protein